MEKKYYLVIDQGTTSCRSILYDSEFNLIDKVAIKLTQSYPKLNWVEHNPIEIWNSQKSTMQQVLINNNINIDEIISIGIANQRETIIAWDKQTGIPVYNAIVWQDSRTIDYCNEISANHSELIKQKTGLNVSCFFSASKINWIIKNVPKAKELIKQKRLLVGTIDSWLLFKLSNHKVHKTDFTNASRTMLFNITTLDWDTQLLDIFNIPKEVLASVHPSSYRFTDMDNKIIDPQSNSFTPINAIAGDQQASLFGQQCFNQGDTKSTFGTGCFVLMNTDKLLINSKNKLISTIACCDSADNVQYALEGSVFNAGTTIEWLSNDLKVLYHPEETDWYAKLAKTNDQDGLYFIPAFTGLGAPYWDPDARGMIIGIERNTRREHIIKAAIEGIGFQVNDVINAMINEHNQLKINSIKVDGGLSKCDFLIQFLSDILNVSIQQSTNSESTSLGIAFLSAINLNKINKNKMRPNKVVDFKPIMDRKKAKLKYDGWNRAVKKILNYKVNDEKEN